jgi:hypothetical protein
VRASETLENADAGRGQASVGRGRNNNGSGSLAYGKQEAFSSQQLTGTS